MNTQVAGRGPKRHRDPMGRQLATRLTSYAAQVRSLPGIQDPVHLDCLVNQLLDSRRRVQYVKRLATVRHDAAVADPSSGRFNPLRGAALRSSQGNTDEAVWLAFLAVHFGKHSKDGWELARRVYGRVGEQGLWDWPSVSGQPSHFRRWLAAQGPALRQFRFNNHRKFESLDAFSPAGTGSIVESFVNWVIAAGSLGQLVRSAQAVVGQNPTEVFDLLYKEVKKVHRFGRLGKFDFLTLLGKLGIAPIEPGSAYIWDGATGPYSGVRLLVTGSSQGQLTRRDADVIYVELGSALQLGMQELEDALCNWQKSPGKYRFFRG